jgi:hypothetical protein
MADKLARQAAGRLAAPQPERRRLTTLHSWLAGFFHITSGFSLFGSIKRN